MGAYNALLAGLTIETDPQFGDTLKLLEDAKETCLSTIHPNERCHEKMQNTLQHTQQLYDKMLSDYKNRFASLSQNITPLSNVSNLQSHQFILASPPGMPSRPEHWKEMDAFDRFLGACERKT